MIEVAVCWCGQFEGPEANVVKSFIIDTESLIGVLDQLVNGKGCIIRLKKE